jgi:uncharacterized cupredoxin-like copper-binding protein
MIKISFHALAKASAVAFFAAAFLPGATLNRASAHENHSTFSAGQPGDPHKPARTVEIAMREEYGLQIFVPEKVEVRRGEQIRFVIHNEGTHDHEFLLATTAENVKHAAIMKKNPDMVHDDPSGITVKPQKTGELFWRFTKAGTFEYSCLIPGHREEGMIGTVTVK